MPPSPICLAPGQVANAIAAQNVFTDYRSRRAANTIRRQTEDLALFTEIPEMLNAVSLNAAASLDDLLPDNDLTTLNGMGVRCQP